jgi:hypothetical protein
MKEDLARTTLQGVDHVSRGSTKDVTPYLTPGVACVLPEIPLTLRLMRTKDLAQTSRLAQALQETTVSDLQADLRGVEKAIAAMENHRDLLRLALQVKVGYSSEDGEPKPSLREAIVQVLRDSPPLRPAEIYSELEAEGWGPRGKNAKAQVAARLSKLVESGHLTRVGEKGSSRYTLPERTTDSG